MCKLAPVWSQYKKKRNFFVLFLPIRFGFYFFHLSQLILVIEFKFKVTWVELVEADVAVLASRRVRLAVRMESERIDGTKVALDPAKLFLKNQVEETGVELADPRRCRRHIHGVLTTAQHHLFIGQM